MFTDIKPVTRPIVKLVDNLEPYWISGFITAEGCFSINLRENIECKAGYEAGLRFSLSQNARDLELINKLKDFFNTGYIVSSDKRNSVELTIKKFNALKQDLVPFLVLGGQNLFCPSKRVWGTKTRQIYSTRS